MKQNLLILLACIGLVAACDSGSFSRDPKQKSSGRSNDGTRQDPNDPANRNINNGPNHPNQGNTSTPTAGGLNGGSFGGNRNNNAPSGRNWGGTLPNPNGGNFGGSWSNPTPIALDLDRNGHIRLSKNPVKFDIDASGVANKIDWIGPQDALLAIDLNKNGIIDSGRELFGDATLVNGSPAKHGYQALASYDSNKDGQITRLDEHFTKLVLWQDKNSNAKSEPNELISLRQTSIDSLHLYYGTKGPMKGKLGNNGSFIGYHSTFKTVNGRFLMADIFFREYSINVATGDKQ